MKETYYFSHDYNARSDAKIRRLIYSLGIEGYGIYWALIEDLYNNDNRIACDYDLIAYDLRVDAGTIIKVIIDFDLFEINDNYFSSISIEKRLNKRNEKSEKARTSASKRWNDTNAMQTHSDSNAIKESKVKESKLKDNKIKDKKTLHLFADSEYFNFEKFCLKLPDWSTDKCKFYHEAAIGYSESKGAKYLDWIAAVKNWDRKQPYTKNKNNYEAGKQQRDELRNRAEQFIASKLLGS